MIYSQKNDTCDVQITSIRDYFCNDCLLPRVHYRFSCASEVVRHLQKHIDVGHKVPDTLMEMFEQFADIDASDDYEALHEAVAIAELRADTANQAHAKDHATLLTLIAALGDPDEYDTAAGAISTGGQLWRATAVDLLARVARELRAALAVMEDGS